MQIETLNDIRLVGRAMKNGWNVSDENRQEVLAQLMNWVRDPDPKYSIAAAKAVMAADAIDAKREATDDKTKESENDRKLKLLELARRVPIGELAELASSNGIIVDGGVTERRTSVAAGTDGSQACGGTGHLDSDSEESTSAD